MLNTGSLYTTRYTGKNLKPFCEKEVLQKWYFSITPLKKSKPTIEGAQNTYLVQSFFSSKHVAIAIQSIVPYEIFFMYTCVHVIIKPGSSKVWVIFHWVRAPFGQFKNKYVILDIFNIFFFFSVFLIIRLVHTIRL